MATKEQKKELTEKVQILVQNKFRGEWRKAFDHYDAIKVKDGRIGRDELLTLLKEADIGNWATRGMWADGIIEELDKNGDSHIAWNEFEAVIKHGN